MKRATLIASLIVFASFWYFIHLDRDAERTASIQAETAQLLAQQIAQLPKGSSEYHKNLQSLKKLLGKVLGAEAKEENPHALIEAFREIKTNRKGQTYHAGYLQTEQKKAFRNRAKNQSILPWLERGPGNCSGRIQAAVFDPSDSSGNTWFAASVGGGIWKTTDAGFSWVNKTSDLLTLSTMCLAICQSNPNIMYAGTGMGYGRVVDLAGSGVWKSTNHGESWFQLESTAHGELLPAINRIIVDPSNENLVLACSNGDYTQGGPNGGDRPSGIFRSTDGGSSWIQVFDPEPVFGPTTDNRVQQLLADPSNFNNLYASVNEVGVIRSTDRGMTWQVSADYFALPHDIGNPPGGAASYQGISVRTELAISLSDPTRLYAAVERPYGIADLYMSRNRGTSWTLVNDLGSDPNWFNSQGLSGAIAYTAGWFNNTIMVHPTNPNTVFVGGVSLYRIDVNSGNSTRNTTQISAGGVNSAGLSVVHSDMHDLQYFVDPSVPNGFRILNGNDGGVAISSDGGQSWQERDGLVTSQFYGVDKKPGENTYIGGLQDNGTYLSPLDPGVNSSWSHILGGDGFEVAWNRKDPNLALGCSQYATLYRTHDGAQTWDTLQAVDGSAPFITKIANSKQDPDLVFSLSSNGIYRSDDFGASWVNIPLPGPWVGHRAFSNVEISPADPNIVWATSRLTYDAAAGSRGGIYVSTDSGLSFSEVTQNLPGGMTESSGMGFDPIDPNTAYLLFSAAGTPKILRTRNLGQTFEDLSGFTSSTVSTNGFPDVAVYALLVMPHQPHTLWAGTEIGLFISENDGETWSYSDNGLPPVGIFQMTIVDGQIILATYGRGIWTVDLPELAGYQPPEVTLAPRLTEVAFNPSGNLALKVDLRSSYEKTVLIMNGESVMTLEANESPKIRTLFYPIGNETSFEVSLISESEGKQLKSISKQVTAYPVSPRKGGGFALENSNDLLLNGLAISQVSRFNSSALHSPHNYADNSEYICQFKQPFVVPNRDALLRYRDIALVEPGTGSVPFGDPQFWDYVIVEATRDGFNWVPLADGYDARANQQWLNAFNSGTSNIGESMYVQHEIDVLDTFSPGDQVFIRFRLWADGGVTGWGWAVDDIQIFPGQSSDMLGLERRFSYPWASLNTQFESIIIANNPTPVPADVVFTARRIDGFGERTAVKTIPAYGFLEEEASQLFPNLEKGPGFTVILESSSNELAGRWVTQNLNTPTGGSPSQAVAVNLNAAPSRKLLFGFMPTTDGFTSAPAIVGLENGSSDLFLTRVDSEGNEETIQPYLFQKEDRPYARLVTDFWPQSDRDYYLIAESSSAHITGTSFVFNTFAEPSLGEVTPLADDDANTELLFPWISNSQDFESQVVINNLGSEETVCTLIARRGDGTSEQIEKTIPARGFLSQRASILFPGMPVGPGYTVEVTASSGPVYGRWVTYNLNSSSGKSPSQGVAYVGDFQANEKDWLFGFLPVTKSLISAIVVVNRSLDPTDVTVYFFNSKGEELESYPFATPLDHLVPAALIINDLPFVKDEDLYAVVRSDSGAICGVTFIFNQGREPAIGNATLLEDYIAPTKK